MTNRNYKVRIKNLNLKKTCFLESSDRASTILNKYRKYLEDLGFQYIRTDKTKPAPNVTVYYFYSKAIFKGREYWLKFPRKNIFRNDAGARAKRYSTNEYLVELHVIKMATKHAPD